MLSLLELGSATLGGSSGATQGPLDAAAVTHAARATSMDALHTRWLSDWIQMLKGEAGYWEQLDTDVWTPQVKGAYPLMGDYQLMPASSTGNFVSIFDVRALNDLTATNLSAADRGIRFDGTGYAAAAGAVITSSPWWCVWIGSNPYPSATAEVLVAQNNGGAGRTTFLQLAATTGLLQTFFNNGTSKLAGGAAFTSNEPRMCAARCLGTAGPADTTVYVDGSATPYATAAEGATYTLENTAFTIGKLNGGGPVNFLASAIGNLCLVGQGTISEANLAKIMRNSNRIFRLSCYGGVTQRPLPNAHYTSRVRLIGPPTAGVSGRFLGSPCAVRLPSGKILAASDDFGGGSGGSNSTSFHISSDNGNTWTLQKADQVGIFWATLFLHNGIPHCYCTSAENGALNIAQSLDEGATWTITKISTGAVIPDLAYAKAPTSFVETATHRWFALDRINTDGGIVVGATRPRWVSVVGHLLSADPTVPANWIQSNELDIGTYRAAMLGGGASSIHEWLEFGMVQRADTSLGLMGRFTYAEGFGAPSIDFDPGTVTLSNPTAITNAEFGECKAHIQPLSGGGYLAIGNKKNVPGYADDRTKLCAWYSANGKTGWQLLNTAGVLPDLGRYNLTEEGVQYPWFFIEGTTLYLFLRLGYNGAPRFHDSNMMTMHRIENFATAMGIGVAGYTQAVTASSPLSWWRMGESSGSVMTDTAGTNPGTYNALQTINVSGAVAGNTAARFNGGQQTTVTHVSALNLGTSAITLEAWVKPTGVAGGTTFSSTNPQQLIIKGAAATTPYNLRLLGGHIDFFWRDAGSVLCNVRSTAEVVVAGAWQHIVVIHTPGSGVLVYLDGVAIPTSTISGTASADRLQTNIENLYFGGFGGSRWFTGDMDEVAVYTRALSLVEIQDHYTKRTLT